ncbi:MAG: hypothetical protein M1823_000229 [Watsoniomyces obsoletus]|nr:MAG: hypothetical protein M1823_000229 [Watsoniomyces obsoletus]
MNVFRPRRKAKETAAENDGGIIAPLSGRTFRRQKKPVSPATPPELDLSTALPSKDNFRTSLLMPNLSARFSMLRAQDDPFSLIGKANDDSVISKRASRMLDLADIAETDSIRPPFAGARTNSTASADGYATDDDSVYQGSMLTRARPGESNNLFGGRQKVYKIPAGGPASTRDLNGAGTRFWYEHDVHRSAFQSLRDVQRREAGSSEGEPTDTRPTRLDNRPRSRTRSISPSDRGSMHERKRETASSTASGPSHNDRSSTAATSIASQGTGSASIKLAGPTPSFVKTRRLYEPGLDLHLHEQQSSALNRFDQLTRQRLAGGASSPPPGAAPAPLSHAGSSSSLRERYERGGPAGTARTNSHAFRPLSPSPPPAAMYRRGSREHLATDRRPSTSSSPHRNHRQSPPLSPVGSDDGESFAMRGAPPPPPPPRDRVRANATGAFARPPVSYDDAQYAQRQLHMFRGRETPTSRRPSQPGTRASSVADMHPADRSSVAPSRTGSEASRHARDAEGSAPLSASSMHQDIPSSTVSETPGIASHGTFLATRSDADSDAEDESNGDQQQQGIIGQARSSESTNEVVETRSATRPSPPTEMDLRPEPLHASRRPSDARSPRAMTHVDHSPAASRKGSTSLAPPDLSGLVRQHLRSDSNQSTIPASSVPASPGFPFPNPRRPISNHTAAGSIRERSLVTPPVEDEMVGWAALPPREVNPATGVPNPLRSIRTTDLPPAFPGQFTPSPVDEMLIRHTRNASIETKREREEFANELAERRRRVQENLKSFVEPDRASTAPTTEALRPSKSDHQRSSPMRTSTALGLLKSKSSMPSMQSHASMTPVKPETSSKAMKMLGISATNAPPKEPIRQPMPEPTRRRTVEDEQHPMVPGEAPAGPSPPPPAGQRNWGQIRRDARREFERRQRENKEAGRQATPLNSLPATPSPPTSSGTGRARADSDASGRRSRSRPRGGTLDTPNGAGLGPVPEMGQGSPWQHHQPPRPVGLPGNPKSHLPEGHQTREKVSGHRRAPIPTSIEVPPQVSFSVRPSPSRPPSATSSASSNDFQTRSRANSGYRGDNGPSSGTLPPHRKRFVQKSAISEPTLVSCTSNISAAVDLAEAAKSGLGRHDGPPPPLPPINPRRRTRFPGTAGDAMAFGRAETAPLPSTSSSTSSGEKTPSPSDAGSMYQHSNWQSSGASRPPTSFPRPRPEMPTSASMPGIAHERRPLVPPVDGSMF